MKKILFLFLILTVGISSCSSDDNSINEPDYEVVFKTFSYSGGGSAGYSNAFMVDVFTKKQNKSGHVIFKIKDYGEFKSDSKTLYYNQGLGKSWSNFTVFVKSNEPLNEAYYESAMFVEE